MTMDEGRKDEGRGTKGRGTMAEGRRTKGEGEEMNDREKVTKRIKSVRDLKVYQLAFETAMEVFKISRSFPVDEKYSLTDQVRRSSR